MKKSDFRKGDTITLEYGSTFYIIDIPEDKLTGAYIVSKGNRVGEWAKESHFGEDNGKENPYRYATHEEKAQLKASIKAGKYVPLSEVNLDPVINNSYSIF